MAEGWSVRDAVAVVGVNRKGGEGVIHTRGQAQGLPLPKFEGEGGGGASAASESIKDRPWLCCCYRFPRVHPCFGMHTSTLFILTNINIRTRMYG